MGVAVSLFIDANRAAVLIAGVRQTWQTVEVVETSSTRPTAGSGIDSSGTARGSLLFAPRLDHRRREVTVSVETYDGSADFTLTIAATGVTSAAADHTSINALLNDLATKVAANGTLNPLVIAEAVDSAGAVSAGAAVALRLRGRLPADLGGTGADYSVTWSATGTGELEAVGDSAGGDVHVWAQLAGENAPAATWAILSRVEAADAGGLLAPIECPSTARIYAQAVTLDRVTGDNAALVPRARIAVAVARSV